MGNLLFVVGYYLVTIPGIPFAALLNKFKQMGNGNEGTIIEFHIWATVFGIVIWVFVVSGGIWALDNLSISLSVK